MENENASVSKNGDDNELIEQLVRLQLEDGSHIDFFRTSKKEVRICRDEHCVILPRASAQVTFDLFALLEPFGKIVEAVKEEATEEAAAMKINVEVVKGEEDVERI